MVISFFNRKVTGFMDRLKIKVFERFFAFFVKSYFSVIGKKAGKRVLYRHYLNKK